MKKQNLFSSLLVSAVALSLAVPSLVSADPTGVPPGGNVDATFNSVTTGNGASASLNGDSFIATGLINLVGRIYSGSADPTDKFVNIEDSDGVRFGDDTGAPQLTISGANGDIADSAGAVTVKDDEGLELTTASGADQISLIPGGFARINANGNLVLDLANGNGTLFFYDGVGDTPLGINHVGLWAPSTPAGPLKIIDSEGLGIADNSGNVRLLIDDTGEISNIFGANSVKISDDQGLQVANTAGTVGLQVAANGNISDPSSDVTVSDNFQTTGYVAAGWNGTPADTSFGAIYSNGAIYGTGGILNSIAGQGLTLNAISPGGFTLNSCLNHTDTSPANGSCDTISGNAGFTINTLTGGQTINATSGGLTINGFTSGGLTVNSASGGIELNGNFDMNNGNKVISNSGTFWGNPAPVWIQDDAIVLGDFAASGAVTGASVGRYYTVNTNYFDPSSKGNNTSVSTYTSPNVGVPSSVTFSYVSTAATKQWWTTNLSCLAGDDIVTTYFNGLSTSGESVPIVFNGAIYVQEHSWTPPVRGNGTSSVSIAIRCFSPNG